MYSNACPWPTCVPACTWPWVALAAAQAVAGAACCAPPFCKVHEAGASAEGSGSVLAQARQAAVLLPCAIMTPAAWPPCPRSKLHLGVMHSGLTLPLPPAALLAAPCPVFLS